MRQRLRLAFQIPHERNTECYRTAGKQGEVIVETLICAPGFLAAFSLCIRSVSNSFGCAGCALQREMLLGVLRFEAVHFRPH
jgi:hypothetical protein